MTLACYGALEIVGVIIIIINVEINSHRGAHLLLRNELAASFYAHRLAQCNAWYRYIALWVITTVFLTTRKYFCVLECLPEISSRHVYIQQKSRIVFLRVIVNTSVITVFRCLWIIHLHNTVNVLRIQYNEPRAASGVFNDARKVPQSLKFVTCIAYNFYSVSVKRCSCTTVWICKISYVS